MDKITALAKYLISKGKGAGQAAGEGLGAAKQWAIKNPGKVGVGAGLGGIAALLAGGPTKKGSLEAHDEDEQRMLDMYANDPEMLEDIKNGYSKSRRGL